jgi:hypothetical protein
MHIKILFLILNKTITAQILKNHWEMLALQRWFIRGCYDLPIQSEDLSLN